MKYRTFRNLVVLGGGTVLASLWGTCLYVGVTRSDRSSEAAGVAASRPSGGAGGGVAVANTQPQPRVNALSGPAAAPPPAQSQTGQRREDQLILNFLATHTATTDKVKDAFPSESFKVNFYCDDGGAKWTRLKIDLDRDGRDDEKWDLKDGRPDKRRVATRDDEQYDREYRWRNAQWVIKN